MGKTVDVAEGQCEKRAGCSGVGESPKRKGTPVQDLVELLKNNPYPGRGIVVGKDTVYYFIMGRSVNSRNRIFAIEPDGIIAPGYTDEALEILKTKRKGSYNVVQIDPDYVPAETELKDVFGITFEQGHNNFEINEALLENVVTENKEIPEAAKIDMIVALITLKYTQSNSVCYVKDGQAIGVGAGQQSRIHCTRLAGNKADQWWLRQMPEVLNLPFKDDVRRPDRDNAIDVYLSDDECDDVLRDGEWQRVFTEQPKALTREQKKDWIAKMSGVTVGSDAFFPFGDNVERARKSGVDYIAEPGGSIRDDNVIEVANKYGIAMAFTGMRLFHH